jgi:hypothetical protein
MISQEVATAPYPGMAGIIFLFATIKHSFKLWEESITCKIILGCYKVNRILCLIMKYYYYYYYYYYYHHHHHHHHHQQQQQQ